MTDTRRPISLLTSVALGLGAALLILLAGGGAAAAAPAILGDGKPAPALPKCFARDDSATGTVYQSTDSAAVRSAVGAAVTSDTVRLAGTCAGVAPQGGTTQTVLINKALTLIGGYTSTDWVNTFPITQPTILDAQGLGRVITASADITIAELTIQHGQSFGGNGGGIFAAGNLTTLGYVNILSNTTVATILNRSSGPGQPASPSSGDGGGAFANGYLVHLPTYNTFELHDPLTVDNNSAGQDGGGLDIRGSADLPIVIFWNNQAGNDGGALNSVGTLYMNQVQADHNRSVNGAVFYASNSANIQYFLCTANIASFAGGCGAFNSFQQVDLSHVTAQDDSADYGAVFDFYQVLANVSQSTFTNNTANAAGTNYYVDSGGSMRNTVYVNNTAPEGSIVATKRLFSAFPLHVDVDFATVLYLGGEDTSVASPLVASTVPTGSAISAAGVGVDISDTIISGYSLDFATDNAPSSTIHGDYNLFDATPVISGTNVTTGTHSLVGNPMFADAAGHLSAGSPAINHGIDVGINVDLDGNPRPSGGGFDIGAYEFQAALLKLFLPLVRR